MKKLLSILTLFCLLAATLLLTACGGDGGSSTEKTFNNAIAKTRALSSFEATMSITVNTTVGDPATGGMTMTTPMTYDIKAKDLFGANPESYIHVVTSMMGESTSVLVYTSGGWSYVSNGEQGYKVSPSAAEDMDLDAISDLADVLENLPANALKNVEMKINADGSRTVSFPLSNEDFGETYTELVESMSEMDFDDVTVTEPRVEVTVKNGYVTKYKIDFDMAMSVEGIEMQMEIMAELAYTKHGGTIVITPPVGYESYPEMPAY